jgi:hypothetical protein
VSEIIASDGLFAEQHKQVLALLADLMIPASAGYPSAADPEIFAGALERLGASESIVVQGLAALEELAGANHQQSFAALSEIDRSRLIEEFKRLQPAFIQVLQAHIVTAYYQDDRVLLALGLPARPPHPGGYDIPATDWSLLEPVRSRKPFYWRSDR